MPVDRPVRALQEGFDFQGTPPVRTIDAQGQRPAPVTPSGSEDVEVMCKDLFGHEPRLPRLSGRQLRQPTTAAEPLQGQGACVAAVACKQLIP